jgi:hypothetical protein
MPRGSRVPEGAAGDDSQVAGAGYRSTQ